MTEEIVPTMAASHEEYAAWLISIELIKDEIKRRLGKENVNTYAEIEEGDEKIFLIKPRHFSIQRTLNQVHTTSGT